MTKEQLLDRIFIKDASGDLLLLANAYPNEAQARKRIGEEKGLLFYNGIDPTGKELHLGHVIHLMLLKRLVDLGHRAIVLVGDFTAQIGDPSGKDTTRKPLTREQIEDHMETYLEQIHKILPRGSFELKYNSMWLAKLTFKEVLSLTGTVTVQQMMERDMFQRRQKENKPIGVHEFLYPLMQGYDSVAMDVDGEAGGNDQTFNMLMGRDLLKIYKNKEKIVLPSKMLADPATGKKMGKTEGNYIAINDEPKSMFDKIMNSISDEMVELVFLGCTNRPTEEIRELAGGDARTFHEALAVEVVSLFHSPEIAKQTQEDFKRIAQGGVPEQMPEGKAGEDVAKTIAAHLGISNSEAHRKIKEGAVSLNGKTVTDPKENVKPGDILRAGRKFLKII